MRALLSRKNGSRGMPREGRSTHTMRLDGHHQHLGVGGGDSRSLRCVHKLDAVSLAMLHTAGKLAGSQAIGAQVALVGQHWKVGVLPLLGRILPRADLVELDAVLVGGKVVLHLAGELA